MANVENPYQIALGHNLVVTSGLAEQQNVLTVRFAKNTVGDPYGSAVAAVSEDIYKELFYYPDEITPPTDLGEIISTPENINILGITMDVRSSYDQSLYIIVDEATVNYMEQNNYNFVVYDKENKANYFKFKSQNGSFTFHYKEAVNETKIYSGQPLFFGEYYISNHGNNLFFTPHDFCNEYIGKTVSFVIEKYEPINSDLYLSEAYNDELLYSTYVPDSPYNDGFYIDNLNIEYYPYKCATLFAYEDSSNFKDFKINLGPNNTDYTEIFIYSILFNLTPPDGDSVAGMIGTEICFFDSEGTEIIGIVIDSNVATIEGLNGIYIKVDATGEYCDISVDNENASQNPLVLFALFGGAIKFFHSGYGRANGILSL